MELSKEMKAELLSELANDCNRMGQKIAGYANPYVTTQPLTIYELDQLEYMTWQMRLKLKLLGAARIYEVDN